MTERQEKAARLLPRVEARHARRLTAFSAPAVWGVGGPEALRRQKLFTQSHRLLLSLTNIVSPRAFKN
jgi:hypothetical protein